MTDAQQRADTLVREIFKSQPNLFQALAPSPKNGEYVAEFIKALRDGLATQYGQMG